MKLVKPKKQTKPTLPKPVVKGARKAAKKADSSAMKQYRKAVRRAKKK